MPSSTTTPPVVEATGRHERLITALERVPDPRDRRGRRFALAPILALTITAVMAGARSFAAIGQWARECSAAELARFGLGRHGAPAESTLRKLFSRLDATALDSAIGAWMYTRTTLTSTGRLVIAIDGKTVRGARTRHRLAPHLVAAFDTAAGVVLGQLRVADKTNKIPTARTLLAGLDLSGAVVTMDALHTLAETVTQILAAGADYVFTVKGNSKTLLAQFKDLPWKTVPSSTTTTTGRGRRTTGTIKVVDAPAWIGFAGATQVAQLRRTVTHRDGRRTVEVVYLITSAGFTDAPPAMLASWVRQHWSIENELHWVRDVTFDEDRSQVRTGAAPQAMATIRNTVIGLLRLTGATNIAQARRHHARHPGHATEIVMTS